MIMKQQQQQRSNIIVVNNVVLYFVIRIVLFVRTVKLVEQSLNLIQNRMKQNKANNLTQQEIVDLITLLKYETALASMMYNIGIVLRQLSLFSDALLYQQGSLMLFQYVFSRYSKKKKLFLSFFLSLNIPFVFS